MAKSVNQKSKILYLAKRLQETGENKTVSMQEILEMLLEKGITAERKSIYDDMEALRSFGMDIKFRRGKPGGYYLASPAAGEKPVKEAGPEKEARPEIEAAPRTPVPAAEETVLLPEKEKQEEPETAEKKWAVKPALSEKAGKEIKLLCESGRRQEIEACLGADARYKEKDRDFFSVTARIVEDPRFYGWLTAMGKSVRITKPKKTAQAYRDYIKGLAKEYKGI